MDEDDEEDENALGASDELFTLAVGVESFELLLGEVFDEFDSGVVTSLTDEVGKFAPKFGPAYALPDVGGGTSHLLVPPVHRGVSHITSTMP